MWRGWWSKSDVMISWRSRGRLLYCSCNCSARSQGKFFSWKTGIRVVGWRVQLWVGLLGCELPGRVSSWAPFSGKSKFQCSQFCFSWGQSDHSEDTFSLQPGWDCQGPVGESGWGGEAVDVPVSWHSLCSSYNPSILSVAGHLQLCQDLQFRDLPSWLPLVICLYCKREKRARRFRALSSFSMSISFAPFSTPPFVHLLLVLVDCVFKKQDKTMNTGLLM